MQTIIDERELTLYEQQSSPCDDKLNRLDWVAHSSYEIGNFRFGVRTTSKRLSSWIDETLSRHRIDEHADALYSIVVGNGDDDTATRGKRDYHILYVGVWPTVRTLALESLGHAFLEELESHLFSSRTDLLFLDAITVAVNDKVVLLPGSILPSLAKLGRSASKYGLSLSPSMAAAIDPDTGKVMPLPRLLLSTSDVSRAVEDLGSPGTAKDLFVVTEPRKVDIVATWDGYHPFEPISRAKTLHHLGGRVFNYDVMGARALIGLGRLVEGANCYGLSPRSAPQLAEGLATLS